MNWYVEVFKKYAVFEGRARRKEYWMFLLFHLIVVALLVVAAVIAMANGSSIGVVLYLAYAVAVFLPSLSVLVRRLHDTGRSGWWFWIALIPIVGSIILVVYLATDSQPGDNRYGANPKGMST